MTNLVCAPGASPEFDRSQFKIQPDGTFRITIRAMAAMAGIDDGSLSRSLQSASSTGVRGGLAQVKKTELPQVLADCPVQGIAKEFGEVFTYVCLAYADHVVFGLDGG